MANREEIYAGSDEIRNSVYYINAGSDEVQETSIGEELYAGSDFVNEGRRIYSSNKGKSYQSNVAKLDPKRHLNVNSKQSRIHRENYINRKENHNKRFDIHKDYLPKYREEPYTPGSRIKETSSNNQQPADTNKPKDVASRLKGSSKTSSSNVNSTKKGSACCTRICSTCQADVVNSMKYCCQKITLYGFIVAVSLTSTTCAIALPYWARQSTYLDSDFGLFQCRAHLGNLTIDEAILMQKNGTIANLTIKILPYDDCIPEQYKDKWVTFRKTLMGLAFSSGIIMVIGLLDVVIVSIISSRTGDFESKYNDWYQVKSIVYGLAALLGWTSVLVIGIASMTVKTIDGGVPISVILTMLSSNMAGLQICLVIRDKVFSIACVLAMVIITAVVVCSFYIPYFMVCLLFVVVLVCVCFGRK